MRHRRGTMSLAPEARAAMAAYRWPGNVRELVNVLERAVVLWQDDVIGAEALSDRLLAPPPPDANVPPTTGLSLEELERRHIEQVMHESTTLEDAAARLGINPTTLWRKRKRYGFD
jgi:NtrC-family two-component system response regulator AlgB